jgi:hypothetical protein
LPAALIVWTRPIATPADLFALIAAGRFSEIWRLLETGSNLPGPRANLSLLLQFVDAADRHRTDDLRAELIRWLATPIIDAPVNTPAEFPVACAAAALSCWIGADTIGVVDALVGAAHDNRWRTREGVVLGLQRIGERRPHPVIEQTAAWGTSQDPFLERAALATLGHAPLLKSPANALLGLDLTAVIIDRLQSLPQARQKTEGNRILSQTLAFVISMFVAALPEIGFARLEQWLMRADKSTRRIVNENLGKARLTKPFAVEVARLKGIEF